MTLYMIHAPLQLRQLHRWAAERGLMRDVPDPRSGRKRTIADMDYVVHTLLRGCFGEAAPQPFRVFSGGGPTGTFYGYSTQEAEALAQLALVAAPPDMLPAFNPSTMRSKPMPECFPEGTCLGFDLRARPIRRLRKALFDPQQGRELSKGAEIDAYRLALLRSSPERARRDAKALSREQAYVGWLQERLANAATVKQVRLACIKRTPTRRGDGPGPEGPDVTFHGNLSVTDVDAFASLLAGGVGRHKSYGFGMLILRPPGTPPMER